VKWTNDHYDRAVADSQLERLERRSLGEGVREGR